MKKIALFIILIFLLLPQINAKANTESRFTVVENSLIGTLDNVLEVNKFNEAFYDGENMLYVMGMLAMEDSLLITEGNDIVGELGKLRVYINSKEIEGNLEYPNLDNTRLGIWDLEWVFTPDDPKYPIVKGVQSIDVRENEELQQERAIEAIALTKSKLSLETTDTFDINLKNKIKGSKYTWTTSNTKVAKVNKKNGIVTALRKGKAVVSCKITLPDGTVKTLKANVTVK